MNALETLQQMRQGAVVDEMGDAIANVVRAVAATGKKGEVVLKLAISAKGDQIVVEDAIVEKPPKPARGLSLFYATEDGVLSRKDPRQPELSGLREAPRPTPITREVQSGS